MSSIANLSDLVNRLSGGSSGNPEHIFWMKVSRVAGALAPNNTAGRWASLWTYDGQPGAGTVPTGSAVYPDNTTSGGLLQTDPSSGSKWLTYGDAVSSVQGTLMLYDRLAQYGGLSGTGTGDQTVNLTPTRYTDGLGNIAFVEIGTQIGASSTTIKLKYKNQAGTDNTYGPTVAFGGSGYREQNRAIMLPLAAGDNGIEKIDAVNVTATTGTAGSYAVVLGHVLAYFNCPAAGISTPSTDLFAGYPSLVECLTDACLSFLWLPGATTPPELNGHLSFVEA